MLRYEGKKVKEIGEMLNLHPVSITQMCIGDTGKQATTSEIKAELDKACGKDTERVYVYNVLKRHGWNKKMPRSKHPKSANVICSLYGRH